MTPPNRSPRSGVIAAALIGFALVVVALVGVRSLIGSDLNFFEASAAEAAPDAPRPEVLSNTQDDDAPSPAAETESSSSETIPAPAPPVDIEVEESVQLIDGRSWALAENALRAPNSGLTWVPLDFNGERLGVANHQASNVFGVTGDEYTENRFAVMIEVPWREVEPERGQFDWERIDQIVAEIEADALPGVGFFIWPQVYGPWIPDWVGAEAGIDFFEDPHQVWEARDGDVSFLMASEIRGFIDGVSERYGPNPHLVHIDMRQPFDEEFGEWVARGAPDSADPEIARWSLTYHQLWIDAFDRNGVDVGKLVSVVARPDYDGEAVLAQGQETGIGQRDGLPERQQVWFAAYGNFIDEEGFLQVETTWVGQDSDAVRYSEATEYTFLDDRFGSVDDTLPRFRSAVLWSLHAGRNWLAPSFGFLAAPGEFPENQLSEDQLAESAEVRELLRWAQLSLGHGPETSNDAWVWLRETTYTELNYNLFTEQDRNDETRSRNVGRFLTQIESEGHETEPANQVSIDQLHPLRAAGIECGGGICDDYLAQQTNQADGNDAVLFDLNPQFRTAEPGVATILVAIDDQQPTTLRREYSNSGEVISTEPVTLDGSGATRTAIFQVPDLAADGSVFGGDFRLVSEGGDVRIDVVRVVSDIVSIEGEG